MHIVLLNQYYAPDDAATAQILADLGVGLARAGHSVSAICSSRSYACPARRYPLSETLDGVRVRRAWSSAFGRRTRIGRALDYATFLAGAAGRLALVERPDVIVSLSTPPLVAGLGAAFARLRRARTLFWVMDVYPDLAFELGALRPGSPIGRLASRVSDWILSASDRVVALDDAMAARLRLHSDVKVAVIPNWADGVAIRPLDPETSSLRKAWGWSERFVVLYSGNMGLAHEFGTVLDAAEALRDRSRVLFAFVGGGPRRDEVQEAVRHRGLSNVEFRPYVPRDRLGDSLAAGDVHLVTLREGMAGMLVPSKIYGILAAGRPTLYVGPPEGEIAEIAARSTCGRRIAPGNARALADAVIEYAEDETRRRSDGESARRLFEERYTKEGGLARFQRLLEDLAAGAENSR
ncbi:MAG: glycosyltransferase family 4 protein [Acidobacteriia bacterium]|nr:glycosyltransferase family 4 protein [Terriglobia bacterium]